MLGKLSRLVLHPITSGRAFCNYDLLFNRLELACLTLYAAALSSSTPIVAEFVRLHCRTVHCGHRCNSS